MLLAEKGTNFKLGFELKMKKKYKRVRCRAYLLSSFSLLYFHACHLPCYIYSCCSWLYFVVVVVAEMMEKGVNFEGFFFLFFNGERMEISVSLVLFLWYSDVADIEEGCL